MRARIEVEIVFRPEHESRMAMIPEGWYGIPYKNGLQCGPDIIAGSKEAVIQEAHSRYPKAKIFDP